MEVSPIRLAIEEDRPTLLQEREERFAIGDDLVQWPRCEQRVLSQQPQEMRVEDGGNTELPVVPAQQQTQQVGVLPDRLGRDPEDVTQDELGNGAVTERTRRWPPDLAFVQCVEVAPLQRVYDGIAQIGNSSPRVNETCRPACRRSCGSARTSDAGARTTPGVRRAA